MNDLFGIRHQLDVGLTDRIEDDTVQFTFTRDFGGLARGSTLSFRAGGSEHSRSYLPVEPAGAEVIATDGHGRPALLRKPAGRGWLLFCTYPLEYMAAVTPHADAGPLVTLYGALAADAGARRPVTVTDPQVGCDVLVRDDGARFAVFASQSAQPLTLKPVVDGAGPAESGWALATLDGEKLDEGVVMGPFGIMVCAITHREEKAR